MYKTEVLWTPTLSSTVQKMLNSSSKTKHVIENEDMVKILLDEYLLLDKAHSLGIRPKTKRLFKVDSGAERSARLLKILMDFGNTVVSEKSFKTYGEDEIIRLVYEYTGLKTKIVSHRYPLTAAKNTDKVRHFEITYSIHKI